MTHLRVFSNDVGWCKGFLLVKQDFSLHPCVMMHSYFFTAVFIYALHISGEHFYIIFYLKAKEQFPKMCVRLHIGFEILISSISPLKFFSSQLLKPAIIRSSCITLIQCYPQGGSNASLGFVCRLLLSTQLDKGMSDGRRSVK